MKDINTAAGMFQRLSLLLIRRNEVDCGKLYNFGVVEEVAGVELVVKGHILRRGLDAPPVYHDG